MLLRRPFRLARWAEALLAVGLGTVMAGTVGSATPPWEAGFARTKITPSESIMLGGYASRQEPFRKVEQDIFVKALALRDNQGNRAILLTCDVVGFRAAQAKPIIDRVAAATGLGRERILLNSSHNHTGPSASAAAGAFLGPTEADRLQRYHEWLQERIVGTAVAALRDLSPAELAFGSGVALFVMNRREPSEQGIKLGHHPRGPADRTVPVLRLTAPGGRLRGLVFGAACHPTTIPPRENAVSGDYPGHAQVYLEKLYAGAPAMFVQGFAGDAGPYPTGRAELARQHGETLGAEVARVLTDGALAPVRGPLRAVQARAKLPLRPPQSKAEIEALARSPQAWQKLAASRMLLRWEEGERPLQEYDAPFSVWQFGSDLTLAAVPGEVVVDYVARLEGALGPLRLWLAGYSNDVFGYLPSARVLREGGYETRGVYSGERFDPAVEEVVVTVMRDLARQAGRPLP